ncbi:MAG: hypothetical protein GYA36_22695 [Veillonellaceae bacterium]|nr:hypothetical protein [Veillonellaceae bacterium]
MNKKKTETNIIRAELNIEKWPLFTTSSFKGKSKEFTRMVKLANGDIETRKVVIGKINNTEVGVFRIFDFKGFCALVKLWEMQGRPVDRGVTFSFHQVAEILGLSWGGKTFGEIKAMLMRLRKIPIDWTNSFYNREKKETESLIESFTILSDLKIYEKSKGGGQMTLFFSSYAFDKRLLGNLLANYSKPLLLNNVLKFKREISILLYRHIDLIMHDKPRFERKTKELLADLDIPAVGYPYPAQRKKLFEPILKELLGVEITSGIITKAELERTKNKEDYKVVFEKQAKKDWPAVVELPQEEEEIIESDSLIVELTKRGITPGVAKELIVQYPEILIREKIEVFDLLRTGKSTMISKNPAGWLRSAIEQNYSAPDNLETKEKKAKRAKAKALADEQMNLVLKAEEYRKWMSSSQESKVWYYLERWKKDHFNQHGEYPSKEQVAAEQSRLIAELPTNEVMQIKCFGRIVYPEDLHKTPGQGTGKE